MKKHQGFTLIELMVTLVVTVFVVTIGLPSFFSMIENNRIASFTNEFIAALHLARNEAIKRGTSVTVCSAANQNYTACGGNTDWGNGWMVFVNPNEDGVFANNATEVLLRVREAIPASTTFTLNPNVNRATYNSAGFAAAGSGNINITISSNACTGNNQRVVNISNTGRVSTTYNACP